MSEKETIVFLLGQYENALNNAASWQVGIKELLAEQKDERFEELIMNRMETATDRFKSSIDKDRNRSGAK
jgi:hypothetical protein